MTTLATRMREGKTHTPGGEQSLGNPRPQLQPTFSRSDTYKLPDSIGTAALLPGWRGEGKTLLEADMT